ncbi:phosphatidylserine decarboxylase family protein [Aspergillus tanneri]|uniref:L-tryptophan decarboxylase PsiD-like domain-containing protein n=1 Tax=Aspergillus tanneri TaxID=1220188 RepID=A0A5M9MR56_9EURO|nr:uncharacterized protein ATNIH1004_005279 [Aspergillus tanneri]KAA8649378.1 hypothetical protein ATNIH1004_005279 [Aspergillus tanneri]
MRLNAVFWIPAILQGAVFAPNGVYGSQGGNDMFSVNDLPQRPDMWMLQDVQSHKRWLSNIIEDVDRNPRLLHPVMKEFQEFIETNPRIYMLFSAMFQEIPNAPLYSNDLNGYPRLRDYQHMLQVLNSVVGSAPSWNNTSPHPSFMPVPINAVLAWAMGTPSGFSAFIDPAVNVMLKKVLDKWGTYLQSPASASVLDGGPTGWLGETAIHNLTVVGNAGRTNYTFCEIEGIRPVDSPDDNSVIANPCESQPYNIVQHIKARDEFWLKGQTYSVIDMLGQDPLADHFVGGVIYQALLTAMSYHRWHAPVSGRIVKAYVIPGTYYSIPLSRGVGNVFNHSQEINIAGQMDAYAYTTAMATRGLIFIESDNPDIGIVAFIGVGLADVSSCEITVKAGDRVKKGDEIGMFHYGGSTSVLMLRNGTTNSAVVTLF